jgi:glycosyltransferase involved in cell wall biosynthesis
MTTTAAQPLLTAGSVDADPTVDIVIPVYNEADDLERCVRRLHRYLTSEFPVAARITIADNASTDATWSIASGLAAELPVVRAVRLPDKGRGGALRAAWGSSDAAVLAYMDVDLSTDLAALLPLVAPLLSGHSDIAIGTRLSHSAQVVRGPKRELISRGYNALLHATLRTRFSDAQCGFKAIRRDRATSLLPLVADTGWFFDTELLVHAERAGLRIHEVPVDWTDDPDSRVDIVATALADLKGIARLALNRPGVRQLRRFVAIGIASTLAYLALYVALRTVADAFLANALALVVTAVANTAANRRLTFGITARRDVVKHQAQGLVVFAAALAITSAALSGLRWLDSQPPRAVEVAVLVVANLLATALRFGLLRSWVFRSHRGLTGNSQDTVRTWSAQPATLGVGIPTTPVRINDCDPCRPEP